MPRNIRFSNVDGTPPVRVLQGIRMMSSRRRAPGIHSSAKRSGGWPSETAFYLLASFLGLVFLIGGASRGDVQSLLLLRPVAAAALVFALFYSNGGQVKSFRFLFLMAALCLASVVIQLVPLPFSWWSALPGRELAVQAVESTGADRPMAPISITPAATWNALYAMLVPLCVLAMAARVPPHYLPRLLPLLLICGFLSGFLGLLQAIRPDTDALYFYRITNRGAAVGLFSNRNHQAAFLAMLFPMLAVFASSPVFGRLPVQARTLAAVAGGLLLIPLLLVTGSRAGLLLGLVGLASVPLLYRTPGTAGAFSRQQRRKIYASLAAVAVLLGIISVALSRALAFQRLFAVTDDADKRLTLWQVSLDQLRNYLPFGSGQGSFPQVYAIHESAVDLGPSYANHAHNDWLELVLVGGIPATILLSIAVAATIYSIYKIFLGNYQLNTPVIFGRLGVVIIVMCGLGSLFDYPLRVPSIASLFVVAAIWTSMALADMGRHSGRGNAAEEASGGRDPSLSMLQVAE